MTTATPPPLPAPVRDRLERTGAGMLVDAEALARVRDRFDAEQAGALARYLHAAQSPNTLRAYRADWVAFAAWCLADDRQSLPADPTDVAVHLAAAAERTTPDGHWALAPSSLQRRAAAIAAVHAAHGLPAPTRADVVRLTLRGIRRIRRRPPAQKRPVLLDTLHRLLAHRPPAAWPSAVARRRDTLLLLAGFAGALRRSELVGLTFDDVTVATDAGTGEPVAVARLHATKTDPDAHRGHQVALPRGTRPDTCCVCALAAWAAVADAHAAAGAAGVRALLERTPTAGGHICADAAHAGGGEALRRLADGRGRPVLCAVDRHGNLADRAMTGRGVAAVVKRYAERAGLDPEHYSAHSLRAGFATQAALAGASDRQIMRQGRWTSPATVHTYIRTAAPLQDNAVTDLGL